MNFRDTTHFPGHEITEAITRLGGRWNGYTWIDQTFFQTTLAKEHLGLALDIEADRMGAALYDEKAFGDERSSVIAELRSYDDPHSLLYDEVLAASLLVHPYRNNTIGWLTDVEAVSRDVAFAFYRRYYTPRNAVLVVGGDFSRDLALRDIRERFGARPAGDEGTHVTTVEPPQSGERRVTVRKPGPNAEVLMAFPAPALGEPAFPAMVLFDALLAGGKGLWFLRGSGALPGTPLQASGAREARSAFQASRYPYVYTVRATSPSGDGLAAAEAALFAALDAARDRDWTDAELARARRQVSAGVARDLDTLWGRVHQLAFFEVSGGYEHLADLEARLESTNAEAVRHFAGQYLTRDRATVGWFVPTPGVAVFASGQAPIRAVTASTTAGGGRPAAPPATATTTLRLSNGLRLHVTPSPSSRLLAIRGRIDAGAAYESKPGLSVLAERLFAGVSRGEDAARLTFALDENPADANAARFITFRASGLPADLPALARAIARGFGADGAAFEAARQEALERARTAEADLDASLATTARSSLFVPTSQLARKPWGAHEAIDSLGPLAVLAFFSRFVVPERTELSIAGPVVPAEVGRQMEAALRSAPSPAGRGAPPTLPKQAPARGPATWTVTHVPRLDAAQNHIDVVVPGDRTHPHDAAATSLLLYLLGETFYSGRLGRALVEPGLVYSVQTTLEEAPGLPGYLRVRTAASRENTGEVLRRIRTILEDAARGTFTAAELAEAKAYVRGKASLDRDGALAAAAWALDNALPGSAPDEVTLLQLNDTSRRLFTRGAPIALVGGPGE